LNNPNVISTAQQVTNIPWWYTYIGDEELDQVKRAFSNKKFSLGSVSTEIEARLAERFGVKHAIVTASGTAALTISLMAMEVGPGDEVIVPNLTWIATVQAVTATGATPVLVECNADNPLINTDLIAAKITSKTKVILPVHLNGRSCDMSAINQLASENNILVLEDSCKAMFSKLEDKYLGTHGDAGCFSTGMISLLSTGYGGYAITDNDEIAERMMLARDHGVSRVGEDQYLMPGFHFKISDILSSIGLAQLDRVDSKIEHVVEIYNRYNQALRDHKYLSVIEVSVDTGEVPLFFEILSPHVTELRAYLTASGVATSHYHPALDRAAYLPTTTPEPNEFDNSTRFVDQTIVLPCGPDQPFENVAEVIQILRDWEPN
jgi:perosamine synthetase